MDWLSPLNAIFTYVLIETEQVASIVELSRQLDPSRLVDTDSGGGANNLHIGDVNDIHSYPYPGDPKPSTSQYAMIGEFGVSGNKIASLRHSSSLALVCWCHTEWRSSASFLSQLAAEILR